MARGARDDVEEEGEPLSVRAGVVIVESDACGEDETDGKNELVGVDGVPVSVTVLSLG